MIKSLITVSGDKIQLWNSLQGQGIPGVLTLLRYIKQHGKMLAIAYIILKYRLNPCIETYGQRSGVSMPIKGGQAPYLGQPFSYWYSNYFSSSFYYASYTLSLLSILSTVAEEELLVDLLLSRRSRKACYGSMERNGRWPKPFPNYYSI